MSLINKMLVDLEARKDGAAVMQPIYDDLRPAVGGRGAPTLARHRGVLAAVAAAVVLTVAYSMYVRQSAAPAPTEPVVVKPTQTVLAAAPVAAAIAQAPATAVAEAPVPALVTAAPVLPIPANVTTDSAPMSAPAAAIAVNPRPLTSTTTAIADAAPTVATPAPRTKPPAAARARAVPSERTAVVAMPAHVTQTDIKIEKTTRMLTPRERALELHRTASGQRKRGDLGAAEASWRAALAQDASLIPARTALVGMHLESGRSTEAIALLQDGLSRAPTHYAFAQLAARLYVDQGNDAHALTTLEATRVHAARDAEYLGFLATLYQRAQRYADAAVTYDAALALRPQEAKWWVGSGIAREAQGDWVGAEAAYARAQDNPALPAALTRFVHERLTALKARS